MSCYPLHPISALILPILCQKVAQNERTLFSYLGSKESHGFVDSLEKINNIGDQVEPWEIYEYFIRNQPISASDHFSAHDKDSDGAVVIHVGATDDRRSWPTDHWVKLINLLIKDFKIAVVDVKDAQHIINKIKDSKVKIFKGDLIQFKSWLTNQKCLVAPDSMAAHLAAFLNGYMSCFNSNENWILSLQNFVPYLKMVIWSYVKQ